MPDRILSSQAAPPPGSGLLQRRVSLRLLLPVVALSLFAWPVVVVAGLSHEHEVMGLRVIASRVSSPMPLLELVNVVNVSEHIELFRSVEDAWGARGANGECVRMKEFVICHEEGLHRLLFPSSLVVGTLRQPLMTGEQLMGEKDVSNSSWCSPKVFDLDCDRTLTSRWVNIQPWRVVRHFHIGTFYDFGRVVYGSVSPPLQTAHYNQGKCENDDGPSGPRLAVVWGGVLVWVICLVVGGKIDDAGDSRIGMILFWVGNVSFGIGWLSLFLWR